MNESDRSAAIQRYITEVFEQFSSGHAIEHAYRPALQRLMEQFDDIIAVNDPKHSEHGAPDFVFLKRSNTKIIKGYAEAKDITVSLDKTEKSNQMERYAGYTNLFLTDYLEFRFYNNGEKYETISLGHVKNGQMHLTPENGARLLRELESFLELPPETIKSGKRLAEIMGGKARRIRDNVEIYLSDEATDARDLSKIYDMMKKLLVHDLDAAKFADMYAQTLVYGLFVARYGDTSPEGFSRSEARDLVPASNPFLRHFFDHIAGAGFDTRLAKIVDELCEIFSVSNVQEIVHKHLKIADNQEHDAKDPIIHFYEDFLQSYDPAERKKMGAYYTPIPVVRFIVRHVDKILKEEFGITKGLASTETITRTVSTQPWRMPGDRKDRLTKEIQEPRVQILDPAVGTATFLNETIKYVYEQNFKGTQEGRWPSYANENLVPRLFGFELMMAPYTVAHLKLGMTLKETGVEKLTNRLNVFLTNTLEEGVPQQPDLFSFGLAEAVSEESRLAAEVKSEKPVMVVMGNPPYSVSSNNKSKWIQNLIADYKKDLNERKINLDDDYIKFIRFAEDMIAKNGSGIVAMITNNSYIDGITHRQMRKHLLETFDKIYILDLHGNSKKKEVAPDGGKDENVFDIMQGVSIVLMVKNGSRKNQLGEVYCNEIWGTRSSKFDSLVQDNVDFRRISYNHPYFFYVEKDGAGQSAYDSGVSINDLFNNKASGFRSGQDNPQVAWSKEQIESVVVDFVSLSEVDYRAKYHLLDGRNHNYAGMKADVRMLEASRVVPTQYRPFDIRWTYYSEKSSGFVARPRNQTMKHFVFKRNIGIIYKRGYIEERAAPVGITSLISHERTWSRAGMQGADTVAPLYIYHEDGTRTPNFNADELKKLTANISQDFVPEDVLDYIYGVLHSPIYRAKYKEFLKIDFPRVPIPTQADFDRLVPLGRELRELHLMKTHGLDEYVTTFPEAGNNTVEKVEFKGPIITESVNGVPYNVEGNVYINDKQYFGGVPETAWNFYIGGYQPAQKWLKDRKGRALSNDELDHYQKIIKILLETDRIMKEIG